MLIYEKDNKLNISFENNMEETDIEIGKDEVKIGEATISENNVLPVPEEGDTGKVPTVQEDGTYSLENIPSELPATTPEDDGKVLTVQEDGSYGLEYIPNELPVAIPEDVGKVVSVDENGSYVLTNAGGGSAPFVVTFSGTTAGGDAACDKTIQEIMGAGKNIRVWYKDSSNALSEMQVTGLSENQMFAILIKAGIMGGNGMLMDITTATINPLETVIKTANFSS